MKQKRCYRVGIETPLGMAISAFLDTCMEAEHKAHQWAEKYGATEYLESPLGMAGGVAMLCAPLRGDVNPDVWRKIDVRGVGECYEPNVPDDFNPKTAIERNHEEEPLTMAEEIELERLALPVASETQLVALLKPKQKIVNGRPMPFVMNETPSLFVFEPNALSGEKAIALGRQWYIAVPFETEAQGLIEVTQKEFYRRRMTMINIS